MAEKQNLPTPGEIEQALTTPWFTANIQTSPNSGVIVTVFDWRGEKYTKLMLYSPVGSQTMILDGEALNDVAFAFQQAKAAIVQ